MTADGGTTPAEAGTGPPGTTGGGTTPAEVGTGPPGTLDGGTTPAEVGTGPPGTLDGRRLLGAALDRWRMACRRSGCPLDSVDDRDATLLDAVLAASAGQAGTSEALAAVTEAARRWADPTVPVRDQLARLAELRVVVVGVVGDEQHPEAHGRSATTAGGRHHGEGDPPDGRTHQVRAVHHAIDRAVAVVTEAALDAATALARTDPLTGAGNRRALEAVGPTVLAADERTHRRTAVVMVDVDGLKQRNDGAGHAAGDRTLVDVARALAQAVRRSDLVFRVGGDEFVTLLSVTDPADVATVMARTELTDAARFTWGAAVTPDDGRTLQELLAAADRRLYDLRTTGSAPAGGGPADAPTTPPPATATLAGRVGGSTTDRAGTTPAAVSRWRAGRRRPGGWRPGRPVPPR